MSRWLAALAALGIAVGVGSCAAAEYSFPLPEVMGSPDGELILAVNLGGQFASISDARLRIAGEHTPGLLGDLNSTRTYPYSAAIDAYSPAAPFGQSGVLGELLPSVAGPFEVDEAFHRISGGGPPNFNTWLDGTANFHFSAGPSAYVTIYRTIANPVVNITSATLFVTGERPSAAATPTADFNGDGAIDGDDLTKWTLGFGLETSHVQGDADGDLDGDGGDFLAWQRQLGGGIAASTPVPEPLTSMLFPMVIAVVRTSAPTRFTLRLNSGCLR